jgi:hypothetical protein
VGTVHLTKVDYLMDDHVNPRRTRSQFEGDPHALTTIEPIMPMHCYMVLTFDPPSYAKDEGNLYWKTAMNEGDLDLLLSNKRKWIYENISMVHLLHQIHTNNYIFNKIFIKHKLA